MDDRINGERTVTALSSLGGSPDGRFGPGNPGRPKGSCHKATPAAQALLDGEAEALTRQAVQMALRGDTGALRLCLERIASPRRDAPVQFALPAMATAADAVQATSAILAAVAEGASRLARELR